MLFLASINIILLSHLKTGDENRFYIRNFYAKHVLRLYVYGYYHHHYPLWGINFTYHPLTLFFLKKIFFVFLIHLVNP